MARACTYIFFYGFLIYVIKTLADRLAHASDSERLCCYIQRVSQSQRGTERGADYLTLSYGFKVLLTWETFQWVKWDILGCCSDSTVLTGFHFVSYFFAFALTQNPRTHGLASPSFLWYPRPRCWGSRLLWNIDIVIFLGECCRWNP